MMSTTRALFFLPFAALFSIASGAPKPIKFGNFPKDFRAELKTTDFKLPIGMVWIDDDRALILEKAGRIYICEPNKAGFPKALYMEIPSTIMFKTDETGALSLEIDPDFHALQNPQKYVYIYYGSVARGNKKSAMRLSKFNHLENGGGLTSRANFLTEKLLWHDTDGWGVTPMWHYGGSIQFGPDKRVYLTLGDKYTEKFQKSSKHNSGCIIRVNRDGSIPAGNLNAKVKPAACWAHGIRNGFSSHWDIQTDRYLIAEVGGNDKCTSMEDIHLGKAGKDYGWPYCEGHCGNPDYPQCDCDKHDDPIWTYEHKDCNGAAVIGGTVPRNKAWPKEYQGAYFYGDFATGDLSFLTFEHDGSEKVKSSTKFGEIESPILIIKDNHDNLWVTTYKNRRGSVFKISYTGENQPPQFNVALASKTDGPLPLTVSFASHASDPEGQQVGYTWYFGDGTTAANQNVVHTFTTAGEYTVQVYANDGKLSTRSKEIVVTAGSIPTSTIISPSAGKTFRAGQTIELAGKGTYTTNDGRQQQLSDDQLQWQFGFIHDDHVHPLGTDPMGSTASYTVPHTGHTYEAGTGLKFELIATSPDGITSVDIVEMMPELTTQQFVSEPSGIGILVDQKLYTTPFEIESIIGFHHTIEVVPVCHNNVVQESSASITGPYDAALDMLVIPAISDLVHIVLVDNSAAGGTWCASPPVEICVAADDNQVATIDCSSYGADYAVSTIKFASFGLPAYGSGGCSGATMGSCHSSLSTAVLEEQCVGQATCNVDVTSATFGGECVASETTMGDFKKVGNGFCRGPTGTSALGAVRKTASLHDCKLECLHTVGCVGIDYSANGKCKLHGKEVTKVKAKGKVECYSLSADTQTRSLVASVVCEQTPPTFTSSTVTSTASSTTTTTTTTVTTVTTTATTVTTFADDEAQNLAAHSFTDTFDKVGNGCCIHVPRHSAPATDTIEVASLQKCKELCSADRDCEAFELFKMSKTTKVCELIYGAPIGANEDCFKMQCWQRSRLEASEEAELLGNDKPNAPSAVPVAVVTTATSTATTATEATTVAAAMVEAEQMPSFLDTFNKLGNGCCVLPANVPKTETAIVNNLQDCKDKCAADGACTAFELTKQKTGKLCQLHFVAPLGVFESCSKQCWKRDETAGDRRLARRSPTAITVTGTPSFAVFSHHLLATVAAVTAAVVIFVVAIVYSKRETTPASSAEELHATAASRV